MSLRPVDLAREVGISTQQVRNYEALGILPPVSRSSSGYRRYEDRHRRALLAFRTLARALDNATATEILRAASAEDVVETCRLLDAAHSYLHQQRRTTERLTASLDVLDGPQDGSGTPLMTGISDLAHQLNIRTSTLRVWEDAGLLTSSRHPTSGTRSYSAAEVHHARVIQVLREAGHRHDQIRPVLDELRIAGNADALRSVLRDRSRDYDRRSCLLLDGGAALHDLFRVCDVLSAGHDGQPQP